MKRLHVMSLYQDAENQNAEEKWLQFDLTESLVVTGFVVQGGTEENFETLDDNSLLNVVDSFDITYQYALDEDWRQYVNLSGDPKVGYMSR